MAFSRLLTALFLIYNAEGLFGAEVRSAIIGGQEAQKYVWPWMVHLNMSDGNGHRWRCGGTILNEQWILTAANCLGQSEKHPEPKLDRSMAWVGVHELKKASYPIAQFLRIENKMVNTEYRYSGGRYTNDIAVVKLKKKLKFTNQIKQVTLAGVDDTFGPSSECWITGWGNVGNDDPLPDPEPLQQLKISIISHSECKAKYPELKSNMLCAGDMSGGKDACQGDFGGPLVCRSGSGMVQVGIMSYGNPAGCGLPGSPGVYTQVSKHLRFIDAYIHGSEDASAEV